MPVAKILPTSNLSKIKNVQLLTFRLSLPKRLRGKNSGALTEWHHAILRVLAKDCVVLQAV